jgi:hypothetical protein
MRMEDDSGEYTRQEQERRERNKRNCRQRKNCSLGVLIIYFLVFLCIWKSKFEYFHPVQRY